MIPTHRIPQIAAAALLCALPSRVSAEPGDADAAFNPNAGGRVQCLAVQADGKFLAGGDFTSIGGQTRNHLARFNADGTLDAAFNPDVDGSVNCIAVLTDGDIMIGGGFANVGGAPRLNLARLNEDGTVDTAFNVAVTGGSAVVNSIALQADGAMLIAGNFSSVAGTGRNRLARLNDDDTLDADFNPGANATVRTVAVQGDGKIVVGGQFGTVAGASRIRLARLNADGTLDTAFDPGVNNHVNCVLVQSDGKLIIAGEFTTVGSDARNYIARLDTAGKAEAGFKPDPNAQVRSVVQQTDGKLLIGGDFFSFGAATTPVLRNRIARLEAAGAVETDFNPDAGNLVHSIALQADGKILAGGTFTSIGGASRNRMARLENDAATSALTIPSISRVQWMRGGASPEALQVIFQLTAEEGDPWVPLGTGTRITGGWELNELDLPSSGLVRALATTTGGHYGGSQGIVLSTNSFEFQPEIAVEHPAGTNLTTGSATVNFGTVVSGAATTKTFTIRNTGLHNLRDLAVTFEGDAASSFTVTTPPDALIAAGASTTFVVSLNAATAGAKTAVLHLSSNDADENPFIINLTAQALDPTADDDGDGLSNAAEILLAGSGFDPGQDSAEAIAKLRAAGVYLRSDVQNLALSQPVLERDATTGHFTLRLGVEKSANLIEWTPLLEAFDYDIAPTGPGPLFYRVFGKKP